MVSISRFLAHAFTTRWTTRRLFPDDALRAATELITSGETSHRGEVRVVIEGSFPLELLVRGVSPRARALQIFSEERVWDTEENTGVLLYVNVADKDIEIVADRGIARCVPQEAWDALCGKIESSFRSGDFRSGLEVGIRGIHGILAIHFPPGDVVRNELPNDPILRW